MEKPTRADPAGPAIGAAAAVLSVEQSRKTLLGLFAARDYGALSAAAEAATVAHPGNAFFWKALGVARSLLGERGDSVIAPLREAARLLPGDAEIFDGLAQALARVGRLHEALAESLRAVSLAPHHPILQTNYGNLLADAGRHCEAIACHRKAVQLDPRLAIGWLNLGAALRPIPWRHGEATYALAQALRLDPDLQPAWDNLLLGQPGFGILHQLEDWPAAQAAWQAVAEKSALPAPIPVGSLAA
jgi:tetratricopeptide (TPR) repeat protein